MLARFANTTIGRAALAASTLFHGLPAMAQDPQSRCEAIYSGLGRAGSAVLGPMFLTSGSIIVLTCIWCLFFNKRDFKKGRRFYALAVVGIISGSLMAGIGGTAIMQGRTANAQIVTPGM